MLHFVLQMINMECFNNVTLVCMISSCVEEERERANPRDEGRPEDGFECVDYNIDNIASTHWTRQQARKLDRKKRAKHKLRGKTFFSSHRRRRPSPGSLSDGDNQCS
jgi:hypothetical protein